MSVDRAFGTARVDNDPGHLIDLLFALNLSVLLYHETRSSATAAGRGMDDLFPAAYDFLLAGRRKRRYINPIE
jgi:hypothetical protein